MDCEIDYNEIDNMFSDASTDVGTAKRLTMHSKTISAPNIIYDFDIFVVVSDTDCEFISGSIISSVTSFMTLKQLCPS